MYAEELLVPWLEAARAAVPGLDVVDVHVHVGLADPAGLLATADGGRRPPPPVEHRATRAVRSR